MQDALHIHQKTLRGKSYPGFTNTDKILVFVLFSTIHEYQECNDQTYYHGAKNADHDDSVTPVYQG